MTRSRASAKAAGSRFERQIADRLKSKVSKFIDRKVKTGALDRGDIANVYTLNDKRVVVEVKDYGGRILMGPWMAEAHEEMANDGADAAVVVAKRRGTTKPGEQWVLMTMDDFVVLLGADRPHS